ncbi:MAG: serine hydrolase domain-containing protein [Leucobacter sp.]
MAHLVGAQIEQLREVLKARVPALLETHSVPGVGVSVRVGGETLALGFGVTNLEHPLPVTENTIFQIGSVSKTFVGLIAAQLEADGLLDIDAPVAPLLEDLGALDPRITMRHLLTHGSGIDAQYMIGRARELLANHADDSIQASIKHYADDELMFDPGTGYSYSGPGFMVAGAVIERVTGKPWADVLQERVLDPAGMGQTFTQADQVITHRVAAPHTVSEGIARLARNEGWQLGWQLPGWDVPGGGVLSTPAELLKYADFAESEDARVNFSSTLAPRSEPGVEVGYAWVKSLKRGFPAIGHDGLTIGYASRFLILPDADIAYSVLSNSVLGKPLVRAVESVVLDALFGAEEPLEVASFDPEKFAFLEGLYDCGFYGQVRLQIRKDRRAFELIALPANRHDGSFTIDPLSSPWLLPAGEGLLSVAPGHSDPDHFVPYVLNDQGKVTALRISSRIAKKVE